MTQLAIDNTITGTTAYDYLHEGITVLAAQAPSLRSTLIAAKMAGYSHVSIDGTGGRSGPPRFAPAGNTTPPPRVPTPRSSPWSSRSATIYALLATSATKVNPTPSPCR
jgi:hypothetical protein